MRDILLPCGYFLVDILLPRENVIGIFGTKKILRRNVCYLMRPTHVSAQGPQVVARTIYLDVENVVQDTLHRHLQYTILYLTQTSPRVDSPLFSRSCSLSCFDRSSSLKLCFIQNLEIRVRVRYLYAVPYREPIRCCILSPSTVNYPRIFRVLRFRYFSGSPPNLRILQSPGESRACGFGYLASVFVYSA